MAAVAFMAAVYAAVAAAAVCVFEVLVVVVPCTVGCTHFQQTVHSLPANFHPCRMITLTAGEPGSTALAAVKEICPGTEYEVTVRYPERRRTLLTTTAGKWAKASAVW